MNDARDEADLVEQFRRDAEALGFGHAEDHPESTADLETADEFIARMKAGQERPAPRRRRWALAAVGVAAAAALVFAVTRPGASPARAEAPPVLDFEFSAAARIAYAPGEDPDDMLRLLVTGSRAAQPEQGSGTIQYRESDNWYAEIDDDGTSKIVPRLSRTWLRPDGSLTTHDLVGRPLTSDGRGAVAAGHGRLESDETLPAGTVDASFERDLSSDPSVLRRQLLDHAECDERTRGAVRSMCLYRGIVELFTTYVVRPELTTAVWRMLRDEDGFRNLGSVEDRAGRDAVALSIIDEDDPRYRNLLLADVDTGQVLGFESILIKADPALKVKPPSVQSFSTLLESRFVERAPER